MQKGSRLRVYRRLNAECSFVQPPICRTAMTMQCLLPLAPEQTTISMRAAPLDQCRPLVALSRCLKCILAHTQHQKVASPGVGRARLQSRSTDKQLRRRWRWSGGWQSRCRSTSDRPSALQYRDVSHQAGKPEGRLGLAGTHRRGDGHLPRVQGHLQQCTTRSRSVGQR